MADSSSYRTNSASNVSLRMDLNDSSASLDKLKAWTPQNFTSILNNPQYSFMEDIKSMFYQSVYDTGYSPDVELDRDLEKFKPVGSPKSSSSNKSKTSLRDLVSENFNDYLNRVKHVHETYQQNHFKKSQFANLSTVQSDSTRFEQSKSSNISLSSNGVPLYHPSQKILKLIGKDYLVPEETFRIPREVLSQDIFNTQKLCRELIEKCGDVEMEIERTLEHCPKIYQYINNNLEPLCNQVDYSLAKVELLKHSKKFIKGKFMDNSVKSVQLGTKKRNVQDVSVILKSLKSLKEIIDLLKVLSTNPAKIQVTNDLIGKGKNLIEKMKSKIQSRNNRKIMSVNILGLYESELNKVSSKTNEKILNEFYNNLISSLRSCVRVDEHEITRMSGEKDSEAAIDKIREYCDSIDVVSNDNLFNSGHSEFYLYPLLALKFESAPFARKMADNLIYLFKIDIELFTKLRKIVTSCYFECFSEVKDKISQLVYSKVLSYSKSSEVSNHVNDKLDLTYLLMVSRSIEIFLNFYELLEEFIKSQLDKHLQDRKEFDSKKKGNYMKSYSDELEEIKEIVKFEMNKVLHSALMKNLNNCMLKPSIDSFMGTYDFLRRMVPDLSFDTLFERSQRNFVEQYFEFKEKKLMEGIDCEDWNPLEVVPENYQNMIYFIEQFSLSEFRDEHNNFAEIARIFEKAEETPTILAEDKPQNVLRIPKGETHVTYKLMLTTLDPIRILYESIKMLSSFRLITIEDISYKVFSLMNTFNTLNKKIVLEGEGYNKGRFKQITQKEISIASANVSIIKYVIFAFIAKNSQLKSVSSFNELVTNADMIIHSCKCKISDLFDISIKSSIDEIAKIDFKNYPNYSQEEVPLSMYVRKFYQFKTIYSSMVNAFDSVAVESILKENLKIFFEKCLKFVEEIKVKISGEQSVKQFKRDMSALKKCLKSINMESNFKEKVDTIRQMLL